MKSFPIINNEELLNCFNRLNELYINDKRKILEAAEIATIGQINQLTISADSIENQITIIKNRIKRTADRSGQNLLIRIIEELFTALLANGAIGVSSINFIDNSFFSLADNSKIQYNQSNKWFWIWQISVEGNELEINIGLRDKTYTPSVIVPDYVLQYIQQGIIAFNYNRNAAALALMSIALEGTLKDILDSPAYFNRYGTPTQANYEIKNMNIFPETNGFRIEFPQPMPTLHSLYLPNNGGPTHHTVRVKRLIKRGIPFIEIRDVNEILDFWSSDTVVNPSVMRINGLGTAIDIARNHARILSPVDLPLDLDEIIQSIRNKLIHLSGVNLAQQVTTDAGLITLEDFIKDKNKVSDTVFSIGETINNLYTKLMNGTL
ncbi:hypothetical protein [Flavobacterium frigoris]|uniref:Uncharacterized protein n=1 Tax=Flavobacterium frigoris (strain PS1) TaxID=1086011 RepID=H7FSY6_FLAFP|nr:hypothetical protein [Flavobacterium frigoris]EIA08683.1 hypothetical protein HJ01_02405 [Flavobacterium frigoris PS1]